MKIKITTPDYRYNNNDNKEYYWHNSYYYENIRKQTIINKIEQIIADISKGLYAYVIAYINIILTLNIPNLKHIYSTKRILVWKLKQINMKKPIPEFKAIYNPYTRHLTVKYGNTITERFFEEQEEWTKISYNGDDKHPNYLHIQLDYDEEAQLLFYPRIDGNNSLNEELGSYFNSSAMNNIPNNIKIVYNDFEYIKELNKLK